jgi:serine/threonine-protein kinase
MLGSILADRYKIIKSLGVGGFGETFLAQDIQQPDKRRCIIKQFNPESNDAFTLATGRRLFKTEAKVLQRLGENDQIPQLFDSFEEKREFYLVQQFVEGRSLNEELRWSQRWSEGKVIAFLKDVLSILAFVHSQNVIHRDLKPANLIRRRTDGKIVLIDFGSVKQLLPYQTSPAYLPSQTVVIGTNGYMPGEQSTGRPRFSSDVYAVGIIAIQALTGRNPNQKQLPENPDTGEILWRRYANVSPALAAVIDTMVRYDFRERYPSAIEALEAVNQLPPPPLLTRRRFLQLAASFAGLGFLGGGATYYARQQGLGLFDLPALWASLSSQVSDLFTTPVPPENAALPESDSEGTEF